MASLRLLVIFVALVGVILTGMGFFSPDDDMPREMIRLLGGQAR